MVIEPELGIPPTSPVVISHSGVPETALVHETALVPYVPGMIPMGSNRRNRKQRRESQFGETSGILRTDAGGFCLSLPCAQGESKPCVQGKSKSNAQLGAGTSGLGSRPSANTTPKPIIVSLDQQPRRQSKKFPTPSATAGPAEAMPLRDSLSPRITSVTLGLHISKRAETCPLLPKACSVSSGIGTSTDSRTPSTQSLRLPLVPKCHSDNALLSSAVIQKSQSDSQLDVQQFAANYSSTEQPTHQATPLTPAQCFQQVLAILFPAFFEWSLLEESKNKLTSDEEDNNASAENDSETEAEEDHDGTKTSNKTCPRLIPGCLQIVLDSNSSTLLPLTNPHSSLLPLTNPHPRLTLSPLLENDVNISQNGYAKKVSALKERVSVSNGGSSSCLSSKDSESGSTMPNTRSRGKKSEHQSSGKTLESQLDKLESLLNTSCPERAGVLPRFMKTRFESRIENLISKYARRKRWLDETSGDIAQRQQHHFVNHLNQVVTTHTMPIIGPTLGLELTIILCEDWNELTVRKRIQKTVEKIKRNWEMKKVMIESPSSASSSGSASGSQTANYSENLMSLKEIHKRMEESLKIVSQSTPEPTGDTEHPAEEEEGQQPPPVPAEELVAAEPDHHPTAPNQLPPNPSISTEQDSENQEEKEKQEDPLTNCRRFLSKSQMVCREWQQCTKNAHKMTKIYERLSKIAERIEKVEQQWEGGK